MDKIRAVYYIHRPWRDRNNFAVLCVNYGPTFINNNNNNVIKVIWHKAASPPHTNGSVVFARWRQCAPHTYKAKKWWSWLPWQHPLEPRNRLWLHQIDWPRKPTPNIVPLANSYHTTAVIAHRKPKVVAMTTSLRCKVSAISAVCRPTTQTPSITNCPVAIVHTKSVKYNFSPKNWCRGNVPQHRWTPI